MIQVEQLTKRYVGTTVVDGVSFSLEEGEIVGFLGPNGAGKSTTLRMITGFVAPTAGGVLVGGQDALAHPLEARRQIGYMPEGVPLYPEMRVREYLSHRAELKGVGRGDRGKEVDRVLERAGVTDARDRIIRQLSKGYRQRVGLADALLGDPPILILDEPTSGLDPNQIRQVRGLIRDLAGSKTVLVSTHILPEVEATCGRVIIIHRGKKVGEGDPKTLLSQATQAAATGPGKGSAPETIMLRGPGSTDAFVRVLENVPDVVGVESKASDQNEALVQVYARGGDRTVDAMFAALVKAGLSLRELRRTAASLEDVFTQLTKEDVAAASPEETASEPEEEGKSEDGS